MTYRIPDQNLVRLRADLERLNKRAKRLGLDPITLAVMAVERSEEKDALGFTVERLTHVVEITGTTPVLDGWTFLAALKHVDGKVLVKTTPGVDLPAIYLNASPETCDHCHVKRARLAAFVLKHTDGRMTLVGRNCLADFIRTTSPDSLASQAEFLTSLDFNGYEVDEDGDDRPRGGRRSQSLNAGDLMVAVLRDVAERGYISRKNANPPKVKATADTAPYRNIDDATEAEHDAARAIVEWAAAWGKDADPNREDYRYNVGVVASMEYLDERVWAIFCSIPSAKARADDRTEARAAEAAKPSEWIGSPTKRQVFTLTMSRPVREIEGDWGTTSLYFFTDKDGNDVRYFASRRIVVETGEFDTYLESKGLCAEHTPPENQYPDYRLVEQCPACHEQVEVKQPKARALAEGDTIEIKATVKAHETFNDRKQTVITRGAVVRLLAPVAA